MKISRTTAEKLNRNRALRQAYGDVIQDVPLDVLESDKAEEYLSSLQKKKEQDKAEKEATSRETEARIKEATSYNSDRLKEDPDARKLTASTDAEGNYVEESFDAWRARLERKYKAISGLDVAKATAGAVVEGTERTGNALVEAPVRMARKDESYFNALGFLNESDRNETTKNNRLYQLGDRIAAIEHMRNKSSGGVGLDESKAAADEISRAQRNIAMAEAATLDPRSGINPKDAKVMLARAQAEYNNLKQVKGATASSWLKLASELPAWAARDVASEVGEEMLGVVPLGRLGKFGALIGGTKAVKAGAAIEKFSQSAKNLPVLGAVQRNSRYIATTAIENAGAGADSYYATKQRLAIEQPELSAEEVERKATIAGNISMGANFVTEQIFRIGGRTIEQRLGQNLDNGLLDVAKSTASESVEESIASGSETYLGNVLVNDKKWDSEAALQNVGGAMVQGAVLGGLTSGTLSSASAGVQAAQDVALASKMKSKEAENLSSMPEIPSVTAAMQEVHAPTATQSNGISSQESKVAGVPLPGDSTAVIPPKKDKVEYAEDVDPTSEVPTQKQKDEDFTKSVRGSLSSSIEQLRNSGQEEQAAALEQYGEEVARAKADGSNPELVAEFEKEYARVEQVKQRKQAEEVANSPEGKKAVDLEARVRSFRKGVDGRDTLSVIDKIRASKDEEALREFSERQFDNADQAFTNGDENLAKIMSREAQTAVDRANVLATRPKKDSDLLDSDTKVVSFSGDNRQRLSNNIKSELEALGMGEDIGEDLNDSLTDPEAVLKNPRRILLNGGLTAAEDIADVRTVIALASKEDIRAEAERVAEFNNNDPMFGKAELNAASLARRVKRRVGDKAWYTRHKEETSKALEKVKAARAEFMDRAAPKEKEEKKPASEILNARNARHAAATKELSYIDTDKKLIAEAWEIAKGEHEYSFDPYNYNDDEGALRDSDYKKHMADKKALLKEYKKAVDSLTKKRDRLRERLNILDSDSNTKANRRTTEEQASARDLSKRPKQKRFKDMSFFQRLAVAKQLRRASNAAEIDSVLKAIAAGKINLVYDEATTKEGQIDKGSRTIYINLAEFTGKNLEARKAERETLAKSARGISAWTVKARRAAMQKFYEEQTPLLLRSSSNFMDAVRHEFQHDKDLEAGVSLDQLKDIDLQMEAAHDPLWKAMKSFVASIDIKPGTSRYYLEVLGYYTTALSNMANTPQLQPMFILATTQGALNYTSTLKHLENFDVGKYVRDKVSGGILESNTIAGQRYETFVDSVIALSQVEKRIEDADIDGALKRDIVDLSFVPQLSATTKVLADNFIAMADGENRLAGNIYTTLPIYSPKGNAGLIDSANKLAAQEGTAVGAMSDSDLTAEIGATGAFGVSDSAAPSTKTKWASMYTLGSDTSASVLKALRIKAKYILSNTDALEDEFRQYIEAKHDRAIQAALDKKEAAKVKDKKVFGSKVEAETHRRKLAESNTMEARFKATVAKLRKEYDAAMAGKPGSRERLNVIFANRPYSAKKKTKDYNSAEQSLRSKILAYVNAQQLADNISAALHSGEEKDRIALLKNIKLGTVTDARNTWYSDYIVKRVGYKEEGKIFTMYKTTSRNKGPKVTSPTVESRDVILINMQKMVYDRLRAAGKSPTMVDDNKYLGTLFDAMLAIEADTGIMPELPTVDGKIILRRPVVVRGENGKVSTTSSGRLEFKDAIIPVGSMQDLLAAHIAQRVNSVYMQIQFKTSMMAAEELGMLSGLEKEDFLFTDYKGDTYNAYNLTTPAIKQQAELTAALIIGRRFLEANKYRPNDDDVYEQAEKALKDPNAFENKYDYTSLDDTEFDTIEEMDAAIDKLEEEIETAQTDSEELMEALERDEYFTGASNLLPDDAREPDVTKDPYLGQSYFMNDADISYRASTKYYDGGELVSSRQNDGYYVPYENPEYYASLKPSAYTSKDVIILKGGPAKPVSKRPVMQSRLLDKSEEDQDTGFLESGSILDSSTKASFFKTFKSILTKEDVNAAVGLVTDRGLVSKLRSAMSATVGLNMLSRVIWDRSKHKNVRTVKEQAEAWAAASLSDVNGGVERLNLAMDELTQDMAVRDQMMLGLIAHDEVGMTPSARRVMRTAFRQRWAQSTGNPAGVDAVIAASDDLRRGVDSMIDKLIAKILSGRSYATSSAAIQEGVDALLASKGRYLYQTYHKFSISSAQVWEKAIKVAIDSAKSDPRGFARPYTGLAGFMTKTSIQTIALVDTAVSAVVDSWENGTATAFSSSRPDGWDNLNSEQKRNAALLALESWFKDSKVIDSGITLDTSKTSLGAGALEAKVLEGPENKPFRDLLGEMHDYGRRVSESVENQINMINGLSMLEALHRQGVLVPLDQIPAGQESLYVRAPLSRISSTYSNMVVHKDFEYVLKNMATRDPVETAIQAALADDAKSFTNAIAVKGLNTFAKFVGYFKMWSVFTAGKLWAAVGVGALSFGLKATFSGKIIKDATTISKMWLANRAGAPIDPTDPLFEDYMYIMASEVIDSAMFAEIGVESKTEDFDAAQRLLGGATSSLDKAGQATELAKANVIAAWTFVEAIPKIAAVLQTRKEINKYKSAMGQAPLTAAEAGNKVRREFPSAKGMPIGLKFFDRIGLSMFLGFTYQTLYASTVGLTQNVADAASMIKEAKSAGNGDALAASSLHLTSVLARTAAQWAAIYGLMTLLRAGLEFPEEELKDEEKKLKRMAEQNFMPSEDPNFMVFIGMSEAGTPIYSNLKMIVHPLDVADTLIKRAIAALSPGAREDVLTVLKDTWPSGFLADMALEGKTLDNTWDRITNAGLLKAINSVNKFGGDPTPDNTMGFMFHIFGMTEIDPFKRIQNVQWGAVSALQNKNDPEANTLHKFMKDQIAADYSMNISQMTEEMEPMLDRIKMKHLDFYNTTMASYKASKMTKKEFLDGIKDDTGLGELRDKTAGVLKGADLKDKEAVEHKKAFVEGAAPDFYKANKKGLLDTTTISPLGKLGPGRREDAGQHAIANRNKASMEDVLFGQPKPIKEFTARVTGAHDADTIHVTDANGRTFKVRLQNIDAFELSQKIDNGTVAIGQEGAAYIKKLLKDDQVRIIQYGTHKGRIVARVITKDGKDLGTVVAGEGYAIMTDVDDLNEGEYPTGAESINAKAPSVYRKDTDD
jgi:endonuclease YncB( thermonuclease family)